MCKCQIHEWGAPYLGGFTTSTTVMGEDRPAAAADGLLAAALDEPLPAPPALHQYRVREQVEVAVVRAWPHGPQAADAYRAPNTLPSISSRVIIFIPCWSRAMVGFDANCLLLGLAGRRCRGLLLPALLEDGSQLLGPPIAATRWTSPACSN